MHRSAIALSLVAALPAAAFAQSARNPVRYLALGDSFTIGTGSTPGQSFPAVLAARWSARCDVTLRNLAVNGYTTQDVIDRELPQRAGFAPAFVTLAIGANDLVRGSSIDAYRAQVVRIFDALAAAGIPGSRVLTLPQPAWNLSPAAASFGDPRELGTRIAGFNDALRSVSLARGARYLDLAPLFLAQARAHQVATDGLHPSAPAYAAWAVAIADALAAGQLGAGWPRC